MQLVLQRFWTPEFSLRTRTFLRSSLPLLSLIACALVFQWWSEGSFLTSRNLSNLSRQVCVNLTLATGMTLIILTGGIDLSVGSVLALSGMTAAISQAHWGWAEMGFSGALLSLVIGVSVGGACGSVIGAGTSRLKISPFIMSLGMMVIARGLTLIFSHAQAVSPVGESLGYLSSGYLAPTPSAALIAGIFLLWGGWTTRQVLRKRLSAGNGIQDIFLAATSLTALAYIFCGYRGIPYMVFCSVLVTFIAMGVLKYTRFGRFLYAIGGNREAAELSGIPVSKTLFVVYFLMGCLAGLAGVLDTTRVNGAVPSAGELAELDAIAAVVIGGTSLMGGVGKISGTILGVLLMGVLNNGMSLVGVSEHYQKVFKGLVIIFAVYLDLRQKRD